MLCLPLLVLDADQYFMQVDECRAEIIRWLRKRWFSVRQEAGFDSLERWALQEISSGSSLSMALYMSK